MEESRMVRPVTNMRAVGLLLCGLGLGYLASLGSVRMPAVQAEVTEEPRREAFKAGGVLNEPVLREIAATLKRIEAKIEKFEKDAKAAPERMGPDKGNLGRTPSGARK